MQFENNHFNVRICMARGGDLEEPPGAQGQGRWPGGATQGVVAAQAQEGLEELSHVEG